MRKYKKLDKIVYDAEEFSGDEKFQKWLNEIALEAEPLDRMPLDSRECNKKDKKSEDSVDNQSLLGNCLWITGRKDFIKLAKKNNIAVLGYQKPETLEFLPVEHVVWELVGIDENYLERVFWRCHDIPWTILETERCIIREFEMEDLDSLFELYAKPGMTEFVEPLYDYEEEAEYERAYITHRYRYYGYGMWLVFDKESGQLIGRAGLEDREYPKAVGGESQTYVQGLDLEKQGNVEGMGGEASRGSQRIELELGYMIAPEFQRKGYATEVCLAIMEYARAELEFDSVNCLIDPENEASLRLMRKLGFDGRGLTDITGKDMCRYQKYL